MITAILLAAAVASAPAPAKKPPKPPIVLTQKQIDELVRQWALEPLPDLLAAKKPKQ